MLIVATNGIPGRGAVVYVLNAVTLTPIFAVPVSTTNRCAPPHCAGVTSTPVIDKGTNTLYLVDLNSDSGPLAFYLYAYDINSMTLKGQPTLIAGTCANSAVPPHTQPLFPTFSATCVPSPSQNCSASTLQQFQRPALLLDRGHIYVAFGAASAGAGNAGEGVNYNGWIFAYNVYQGQATLSLAGPPYCTTRSLAATMQGATPQGMGGIWQFQAGLAADVTGNVYAATGNGYSNPMASDPDDDGSSYVQVAGASWTGALFGKYRDADYAFLDEQDLDVGSTGPIVLPVNDHTQRILGAGKQGKFTVLNPANMLPVQSAFRAALNLYSPILMDEGNVEPGTVNCKTALVCDGNNGGWPSNNPSNPQVCCPNGCKDWAECLAKIHGSHPHIHGQPCYANGNIFVWGEKDYPRYVPWNAATGTSNGQAIPISLGDAAPSYNYGDFQESAMPGGLMSISSNQGANPILWAMVPKDSGPMGEWLKAFDISNLAAQQSHIWQADLGGSTVLGAQAHSYPTIANGIVYAASNGPGVGPNGAVPQIRAFASPGPVPIWTDSFRFESIGERASAAIGWPAASQGQYNEWMVEVHQGYSGLLWDRASPLVTGPGLGTSQQYESGGLYPSIASEAGVGIIEVHQGVGGALYYHEALWTTQNTGTAYGLAWSSTGHGKYDDVGYHPAVALGQTASGVANTTVIEVHQGSQGVGPLWYRTATWSNSSIPFNNSHSYDAGENPSVAYLTTPTLAAGVVVEVHQGRDGVGPLWYKTGVLQGDLTIQWNNAQKYEDAGEFPSVAVCGAYVIEVHQGQDGAGPLWYRTGTLNSDQSISWSNSNVYDNIGTYPKIACDVYSRVGVEVHQGAPGLSSLWARPFVF